MENEWICAICLEGNQHDCLNLVPCNHMFHRGCIMEHVHRGRHDCPYCRQQFDLQHLPNVNILQYENNNLENNNLENNINNNQEINNNVNRILDFFQFINEMDNNNLNDVVNHLNNNRNLNIPNIYGNINNINNRYNFIVNNLFI